MCGEIKALLSGEASSNRSTDCHRPGDMLMKDAVAFMRWERVVPWKILSLKARPGKRPVPVGFGSRDPKFLRQLGPGSQVWVVTRIANQLSLAGRVSVQEVFDRNSLSKAEWPREIADLCEQWPFVAMSDHLTSEFFETNCAEDAKESLGFRFTQSQTVDYKDGPLDDAFRKCMEQGRKTIFLSYRWAEGRPFALAIAKEFRSNGWSPWLDAMAIPDYMKKGDPGVNKARLETLIQLGIKHSALAVVINTWSFGRTAWTRMELEHICSNGVPWFQVIPTARERECNKPTIFGSKPKLVVQTILG